MTQPDEIMGLSDSAPSRVFVASILLADGSAEQAFGTRPEIAIALLRELTRKKSTQTPLLVTEYKIERNVLFLRGFGKDYP
jgi:hypothetical protein